MLYTKFSNVNIIRNVSKFFIHTYKVSAPEQGHFAFLHLFTFKLRLKLIYL
jgi:hypothetical protein